MVSTGRLMAYYSFLPFFYYSDEDCNNGHLLGTTEDETTVTIRSVADAVAEVNDKRCSQSKDGYTYNYKMLLSTVVGAYLVYVLVTIALKIAIRTIKFGICELIAPIPIASYIDPKTSKKAFDNWVSTSVKVYLDLFTRLIVVYFIVFIFSILFDGGRVQQIFGKYGFFQGTMVLLFIIVGLLHFAQEMPKFISGMLGVSDGFGDMADMFRGQGFRALAGTAGMVAGTAKSGVSAFRNSWRASKFNDPGRSGVQRAALSGFSALNALRHGITASASAAYRGSRALPNNTQNQGIREGFNSAYHSGDETVRAQFSRLDTKRQARQNNRTQNANIGIARAAINDLQVGGAEYNRRLSAVTSANAQAQNDLNYARHLQSVASDDLTSAEGALATANGNLQREQSRVDAAQSALDHENDVYNQRRANLTQRRDVYQQYARTLEARESASRDIQYWRNKLNGATTEADRLSAQIGLTDAINNYQRIDQEFSKIIADNQGKGFRFETDSADAWNRYNQSEQNLSQAETNHTTNVTRLQADLTTATTARDNAQIVVNDAQEDVMDATNTLNEMQRAVEEAQKNAMDRNAELVNFDATIQSEIDAQQRVIEDAEAAKIHLNAERAANAFHEFIGDSVPRGQDFIDLASHSRSQKADVLQKEAFGKIEENVSLLKTLPGGDSFEYKTKTGATLTASFAAMINAKNQISAGATSVDITDSNGRVHTISAADFGEYFKAAQKTVGVEYVNAVCKGLIDNATVRNSQQREIQYINSLNISEELKHELLYGEDGRHGIVYDYGKYLLTATDRAEEWQTHGENLRNHEKLLERQQNGSGH